MDPNQPQQPIPIPPQPTIPVQTQPTVKPVQSASSAPPKKPKSALATFSILFFVLFIGIGGYFEYQKLMSTNVKSSPTPTATPSPSPTSDPTAGWKTYTNEKYNYEIKFPTEFTIGVNGFGGTTPERANALIIYNSIIKEPTVYLNITITVNPKGGAALESKARAHLKKLTGHVFKENSITEKELGFVPQNDKIITDLTKTTFQNLVAYRYVVEGSYVNDGISEGIVASKQHQFIWFEYQDNVYLITIKNIENITLLPNQILFTFKFVDNSTGSPSPKPTPPAGWKANTFTAQDLTIYTPTDWQSGSQDYATTSSTLLRFWKKVSPDIVPIQLDIRLNWDNTGNTRDQTKNYQVGSIIDAYRLDPPKKTEAALERYQTNIYFEYSGKVYIFTCIHNWVADYLDTCNKMLETLSFSK